MRTFLILLALSAAFISQAIAITDSKVEDVLARLDLELEQRDKYIANHQRLIDSLRHDARESASPVKRLEAMAQLVDAFTSFNNDSAIYYCHQGLLKAQRLGEDSLAQMFRLKRAKVLPNAAFIHEAVNDFTQIDTTGMPVDMLRVYFDTGRQMYSYIASFYPGYPDVKSEWESRSRLKQEELVAVLPSQSPAYKLNLGEHYFVNNDLPRARAYLNEIVDNLPDNDNLYARACHMLADIAHIKGHDDDYAYYLALSAIADIKSATLEVTSLQELGALMYERGDVERAYSYLSAALANAVQCRAAMRMIESSSSLPIIDSAHNREISAWRTRIYSVMALMGVLLLALVAALFMLYRQMQRMRLMQQSLENANKVKEVYISQFLNLCSIYMDKLNQFAKTVNRKIASNNVDDLYKITKSGKFVEEQSREFYDVFDKAFLHIYPSFVASVNTLLQPDHQIELREGEKLNTDLRILAFMRLGIDDSNRIAQILNYSVYTIYTYRNKLKNRAINRDTFEQDVMQIGSI